METRDTSTKRSLRGLASADPQTRQAVARKGGQAVSKNRNHMAEIGRKGGEAVSRDRQHMAEIGRKGGETSQSHRTQTAKTPSDKDALTHNQKESGEFEREVPSLKRRSGNDETDNYAVGNERNAI